MIGYSAFCEQLLRIGIDIPVLIIGEIALPTVLSWRKRFLAQKFYPNLVIVASIAENLDNGVNTLHLDKQFDVGVTHSKPRCYTEARILIET